MSDPTERESEALEAAADEMCAVNYPGGIDRDEALAIMRSHGLRGP